MNREELLQLIAEAQQHQCELDDVEVKLAQHGTPQRLFESLSAFANRTGGGGILFGIDEKKNFEIVGVGNPHQLKEEIRNLFAPQRDPALRPEFTVIEVEGKTITVNSGR